MNENIRTHLSKIYNAVEYMSSDEMRDNGQDSLLVLDMSQDMLADLLDQGQLRPTLDYVRNFCDVADGPDDLARMAGEIDSMES